MSDPFNLQNLDYDKLYPLENNEEDLLPLETDGDLQGVLDALIELHQLDSETNQIEQFQQDHNSIVQAISLNKTMQKKVQAHIAFIDQLLAKNNTAIMNVRQTANAESRFGQRLYLHKGYSNNVKYFDDSELLHKSPVSSPPEQRQEDEEGEKTEDDDDDEEETGIEDDEEEENEADCEKRQAKKSWSRAERLRLANGIHSEARRTIAYEHVMNNEEWRVWEVDKLAGQSLENFPVDRLDWDRISNIHVLTRTKTECLIQWTTQEHPIINKTPWSEQESGRLTELVEEIGINGQWERIASKLNTNRTISQCFSHYMAAKHHASTKSFKWTKEEDNKLSIAIKTFGDCNWQLIAAEMKGRTGQQCLQRWAKSINPAIDRSKWKPEEIEILKRAVQLYGQGNWTKVQRLLPGRTDMQCRERYCNITTPALVRTKLTSEELEKLVSLVNEIGPKWSQIASYFPGRTDNHMLRAHANHLKAKERKKMKEARDLLKKQQLEAKEEKQRLKREAREAKIQEQMNSIPRKRGRPRKTKDSSSSEDETSSTDCDDDEEATDSTNDSEEDTIEIFDDDPDIFERPAKRSRRARMHEKDSEFKMHIREPLTATRRSTRTSTRNAN